MYKCIECGHLFDEGEEVTWIETHKEYNEPMSGCPLCKSGYKEIEPCEICGVYSDGETYCEDCKKTVKERFMNLVNANFNRKERSLLNELYDCEPI